MIGLRFERLVVVKETQKTKDGHKKWLCVCDCGNQTIVDGRDLRRGKTRSCGCLLHEYSKNQKNNFKHGDNHIRLYKIWVNMRDRCNRKKNKNYKNYGGRGIHVCKEWEDYIMFKKWALNHNYNDNLTIDRINVNGDYSPENCRWITIQEQANNKRNNKKITYNGETHTIAEWSKIKGYSKGLISSRLSKGWEVEKAIETPPIKNISKKYKKDIDYKD